MSKKYTCSVCSRDCKMDCIYCETCQAWVHYECQGVDEPDCKIWRRIPLDYVCVSCRIACNGSSFDYLMGLERLENSAREGIKSLTVAAEKEHLFIKSTDLDTTVHTNFESIRQDPCSINIMAAYHLSSKTALYSTGDGDCLFNSFSTYLVGNESKSIELRYRCSIELVLNKDKIQKHPMYSGFLLCSPDFRDECLECPTLGKPVSVFCMMALSNLLNLKVESVYPAMNGSKDYSFVKLNCVFTPIFCDPEKPTITIMWTNTNTANKNGFIKKRKALWIPNYFVPLVSLTQTSERVELTSDYIEIAASPKSTKSAVRTDAESIRETILGSSTWLEDPAMEDIQIPPSQSTSEIEDSHRDTRSRQMYDYELNDDCTYVPNLSTRRVVSNKNRKKIT